MALYRQDFKKVWKILLQKILITFSPTICIVYSGMIITFLFASCLCGAIFRSFNNLIFKLISESLYCRYGSIVRKTKKSSTANKRQLEDQLWTLEAHTVDMISCLWSEQILSERQKGVIFSKLSPRLVEQLSKSVPNVDGALSLRSHVALAPYTYAPALTMRFKETDNRMWFDTAIEPGLDNLGKFLKKVVVELRDWIVFQ